MSNDHERDDSATPLRLAIPFAPLALALVMSQLPGVPTTPAASPGGATTAVRTGLPVPAGHKRLTMDRPALQLLQFQVERGSEEAARQYYTGTVSPHLKLLTPDTILASTLKDLLTYFGYSDVAPRDLHRLASAEIMRLSAAGDILATRFFAPKISTVTTPASVPAAFGWRKLVRLRAKVGSAAETNGFESLMFLQNTFEATVAGDPFDPKRNFSKFNQALAIRKSGPFSDQRHSLYFFAYGPLVKTAVVNGKELPVVDANGVFQDAAPLASNLAATFDGRDPETGLGAAQYFVPDSCAQCHGRTTQRAKANFLDTDHWIDRVTPRYELTDPRFLQEDFTALAASPHGVLYDGGKDETTTGYTAAFDVVRQLNTEIRDQNARIPGAGNFQLAAAQKWLDLHDPNGAGARHVSPPRRGIGPTTWDPQNESHRKTLYYLNRYCYRCHSSIKYNVFDLAAVKARRGAIPLRVLDIDEPTNWMPQDRPFPGLQADPLNGGGTATGDLQEFLDLLSQLQ